MKKIAILGCENSHADTFLKLIRKDASFSDVEVVGIYSNEETASARLAEQFGVPVLEHPEDAVGKIDGLVVTARHGGLHYPYAKPYISSGIPMFIDKPITVDEDDAVTFMRDCQSHGVRLCGGSCCKFGSGVQELKRDAEQDVDGKTLGGFVRAPINPENPYGGFFFYTQHLVEMMTEVFGKYPRSVRAFAHGNEVTAVFRYENYDVTGLYSATGGQYYIARCAEKSTKSFSGFEGDSFRKEFAEFYELLHGGEQPMSYSDFIAPVFILNAVYRSLQSGRDEIVRKEDV